MSTLKQRKAELRKLSREIGPLYEIPRPQELKKAIGAEYRRWLANHIASPAHLKAVKKWLAVAKARATAHVRRVA